MMAKLAVIFYVFLKVGTFGYGGGPSMIPLLQVEVVDRHQWFSETEFVDALALANALPGPVMTKMPLFVGYKLAGYLGALVALIATILPSGVAILVLATLFFAYKDKPQVQASLKAVRPAVVALLAMVVYDVFPHSVKSWHTGLIAVVAFAAVVWFKIHPALVILLAALFGILIY